MRETHGNWRFCRLAVALGFASLVLFTALQSGRSGAAESVDGTGKARLVFVNGTRIAAVNADGSDRRTLTHRGRSLGRYDEQFDRAPRVSPDGSRFVFLRDVDGDRGETTKLMVASIDGTGTRTVSSADRLTPKTQRHVPS
ncbi:MAG: hypothetical protein M3Y23_03535, partial [Actinomycetota bacterium]|nr:hypothetical protein [Actinomycetota bacterium]